MKQEGWRGLEWCRAPFALAEIKYQNCPLAQFSPLEVREKGPEGLSMVALCLLPELHGEVSQVLSIRTWWGSWRKTLQKYEVFPTPHDWGPREFLTLTLAHTQPSVIHQNYSLSVPLTYGAATGRPVFGAVSLCVPLTHQIFGWCLPCKLRSVTDSRKVIDFQLV